MTITGSALRNFVVSRRSVRSFTDEPVPRALIRELIEDAIWAPSPHNSQPWRFTALFDVEERRRLAGAMASRLAEELTADGLAPEEIEQQTTRSKGRIVSAPVAVLCSLERDGLVVYPDERRNALEWQMAVQSVGSALQTLFLLAHERGIGSCWMAAPMYTPEVVRQALGLPSEYAPQALVLMGHEARPGKVRPRRPTDELLELR